MDKIAVQEIRLEDYTPPDFLIETIHLTFELSATKTIVHSELMVKRHGAHQKALVLQGENQKLLSIRCDDIDLNANEYTVQDEDLTIPLLKEAFKLEIVTEIHPETNTSLSGLYLSNGNFCTQCEAEGFRRITYYLDRPDVMALFTTKIIADKNLYPVLLSNGNCIEKGDLPNQMHYVVWQDPYKKPSYLFALVAGQLVAVKDQFTTASKRLVNLEIYVEAANRDKCAHAMQAVKKAMRWDEEVYGREYDLDVYMIVAVGDFNMGAMENKGLNIFNTKYILAEPATATDDDYLHVEAVIAHEYFHNWTGNRITCRDWFQLSLKEGLTIFRDQSFTADTTSAIVARIRDVNVLRTQQFPEDAGPLAHNVQPDAYMEINNFYTATIYEKGAEVIRMLRTIIGQDAFRRGMDLYFTRHDGQAVTINEFLKAMADASEADLSQFKAWYTQAGTPHLTVTENYDAALGTYTLQFKQDIQATPTQMHKKALPIPVVLALLDSKGTEIPGTQQTFILKQAEDMLVFKGMQAKPIPSLLRHFSAPVVMHYDYQDSDLAILMQYDQDGFNRWEAGFRYATRIMMKLVNDFRQDKAMMVDPAYLRAYAHNLQAGHKDQLFFAEILNLPSEKYLAEMMSVVDPIGIHVAREKLLEALAEHCKHEYMEIYQTHHDRAASYEYNLDSYGQRQLKNIALMYLMKLHDPHIHEALGWEQFYQELKENMTDTYAALRFLIDTDHPKRAEALQAFYAAYADDALVVDKWFAVQASSTRPGTLERVMELVNHPAFDRKNPNKVYALIGTFGQNNAVFHENHGRGYAFLAHFIRELDTINPQIAARMVKPFTAWRRFDEKRQAMMQTELRAILNMKGLSRDLFEIVHKSLASPETIMSH